MAAGSASDKVLTQVEIEGYTATFFPEVFSLNQAGAVSLDTNPPFSASMQGGNTYLKKHRNRPTSGDQTPTANTDLTVNAFGSDSEIGVIVRRADAFGNEDLASIAGGEEVNSWKLDVGKHIANEIAVNAEKRFLQKVIPGVISQATSPLYATNCVDNSTTAFDYTMFASANALLGENVGQLSICMMHSDVFWNSQLNTMLTSTPDWNALNAYRALGVTPVGMVGNLRIWLNDRCYNTGGVYDTVLMAPGSLYMGIQLQNAVEWDRQILKAGGTDIVTYKTAYSPHVPGVSFTGTAPTVIGGATDAALLLATNWTARTGYSIKENPVVVIKTLK